MELLLNEIFQYLTENDWDVIGCHSTDSYNDRILFLNKEHLIKTLPPNKFILCVGNSKKLWKTAKDFLDRGIPDPFDHIISPKAVQYCHQICHSHGISCTPFYTSSSEPFLVSFQDLAVATGIGVYSDEIKLVIHPKFGPWFALRFALIIDSDWNSHSLSISRLPVASSFSLDNIDFNIAKSLLVDGLMGDRYDPYRHIAARRSVPIGLAEVYSDEQIAYHYDLESYSSFSGEQDLWNAAAKQL
jgi:hypothetical protein